jgi:hypothetical protein
MSTIRMTKVYAEEENTRNKTKEGAGGCNWN